jgi:DtxR family transcriptional regulator, Mn-dependent transcriptional regulator
MSESKPSATVENYLSLLFVFERDGEPIVGARIAEQLGVTPPTVTNTLKRMERDGLVRLDGPHGPALTESGRVAAHTVMRRHILTEWMLVRLLSWSKIHSQAHEMEHAISQEVEDALQREWDYPHTCPHGNPLPGHEDIVAAWVPLTAIPLNQPVTVRRVHELAEETPGLLAFLEEKEITINQQVTVTEVLPFNQTLTLRLSGGREVSLGLSIAKYVFAELSVGT